jgi:hypothetical protein
VKLRPTPSRFIPVVLLSLAALFAGGCVYLRLLQLKGQLADFDKHFALKTEKGLEIHCLDPVLLGEDLRWLGAEPEKIQKSSNVETWHIRWVKDAPPGAVEAQIHDVDLYADLRDHQVVGLRIPEHYFEVFPKNLLINLLRSTGKAHIDKQTHQAQIDTTAAEAAAGITTPDLPSVEQLLGRPTEIRSDPNSLRYKYRYRAQTPNGPGKVIEVVFVFDTKSKLLRHLVGKLPKGTLNFDFPPPHPPKT